jgi:uncharacterized membrane protein
MVAKLRVVWTRLLESLWFVPIGIGIASIVLAIGMVEISARIDPDALARFPRIFGASADSSRSLLSSIGASVITVVGVTFSLTMVAVTQASAQYTSRILRTFMRDRPTQIVLGVFVGIFAYCLLVLRTIRSADESPFVPSLAVVLGIVFALGAMGALIYFVHHMATTLQVSSLLERVGRETVKAVDRLFPDDVGVEASADQREAALAHLRSATWRPVAAKSTGYLQAVDRRRLVTAAEQHRACVQLGAPIGGFVIEHTPIAWTTPETNSAARTVDDSSDGASGSPEALDDEICRCCSFGSFRTLDQDAGFGVRQIVDIALRALSPGVNDTTTAVNCVDWLGAVLVRLANRRIETPYRVKDGVVRVIAEGPTFESLLALSVDEIRQNAAGNVTVLAALLGLLTRVATHVRAPARRRSVELQARLAAEHAERNVQAVHDRDALRRLASEALGARGAGR